MHRAIKDFLQEIDHLIATERSIDVFALDHIYIPNLNSVDVVCSSYDDGVDGLYFILKISANDGEMSFLRICTGDGGVLNHRSRLSNDISKLKVKTSEDWTDF